MIKVRRGVLLSSSSPPLVVGPAYGFRIDRSLSGSSSWGAAVVVQPTGLDGQPGDRLELAPSDAGWITLPGGVSRLSITSSAPAGAPTPVDVWWASEPGERQEAIAQTVGQELGAVNEIGIGVGASVIIGNCRAESLLVLVTLSAGAARNFSIQPGYAGGLYPAIVVGSVAAGPSSTYFAIGPGVAAAPGLAGVLAVPLPAAFALTVAGGLAGLSSFYVWGR